MPHQQWTDHGCWNGTVLIHRGFPFAQQCILCLFTFPVFAKLASSEKSTWLKNETSVRIFLRIQLQKLTRFKKSLPYKSWCNDIRYGWNLSWCKILNTDRWLIPPFFSICLLLACAFSATKAKIAAALFSLTIGRPLTLENRSFSRSDVLTLESNAWLTDMSTENAYFLPMSTIP